MPDGFSVVTGRAGFPAGPRYQGGQDADAHVGIQEVNGAIGEHGIRPAGVEAVDLPVIGAVDGTWPRTRGAIRRCPLKHDAIVKCSPGSA